MSIGGGGLLDRLNNLDRQKKKILLIVIAIATILVAVVGGTYAYFNSLVNITNEEAKTTSGKTATVASATMELGGDVSSTDMHPGETIVKSLLVNGTCGDGSTDCTPTKANIKVTAEIDEAYGTDVEWTLYKSTTPIYCKSDIVKSTTGDTNKYYTTSTCKSVATDNASWNTTAAIDFASTEWTSKELKRGNKTGVTIKEIEVKGTTKNEAYYLVVSYKNTDKPQDNQQGKEFAITVDFEQIIASGSNTGSGSGSGETGGSGTGGSSGGSSSLGKTAVDTLKEDATSDSSLVLDGTEDNNLRYIGVNPNNYVSFNGELWRIIGVMNNIKTTESGRGESRIKLIRNESIGLLSWDNKPSGTGSSTSSYGSNDWSDSRLQEMLNSGAYWNRTSGSCPRGKNGATIACDYSGTGLTEEAKELIGDAVWSLGGTASNESTAIQYYAFERGATVYSGRPTSWTGKVGLMYASDFGYATGGENRESCLSKDLGNGWYNSDCYLSDWLYKHGVFEYKWTLTAGSAESYSLAYILNGGIPSFCGATGTTINVNPVVYLKSNTKITSGDGTVKSPFILGA